jgi:hypothetical protein
MLIIIYFCMKCRSVVYKEQLRLNQAATSTLMARLEAQRAMCDSSETELRKKYQQRDDLERQIKPERKRYRVDDGLLEERHSESVKYLSAMKLKSSPLKQELRVFLEEAQKNSDAYISLGEEEIGEGTSTRASAFSNARNEQSKVINFPRRSHSIEQNTVDSERGRTLVREKLEELAIKERHRSRRRERMETMTSRGTGTPMRSRDDKGKTTAQQCYESETENYHASETVSIPRTSSLPPSPPYRAAGMQGTPRYPADQSILQQKNKVLHHRLIPRSEDDENMNHVGKGNVDKWLHMLMDNQQQGQAVYHCSDEQHDDEEDNASEEQHMQSRIDEESCRNEITECSDEIVEVEGEIASDQGTVQCRDSFGIKEREEKKIWFPRSDSSRGFRSLPSSPSKILGMRRGVECIGRKPKVAGEDNCRYGYEDAVSTSSSKFLSRCKQAIKKAVNK